MVNQNDPIDWSYVKEEDKCSRCGDPIRDDAPEIQYHKNGDKTDVCVTCFTLITGNIHP